MLFALEDSELVVYDCETKESLILMQNIHHGYDDYSTLFSLDFVYVETLLRWWENQWDFDDPWALLDLIKKPKTLWDWEFSHGTEEWDAI